MPTLEPTAAVAQDDLVLPIAGRDGAVREYHVPPCTAGDAMDLVALQAVLGAVGQHRQVSPESFAASLTEDASLRHRIQRLVAGGYTTEGILALPLGPVSDEMIADGVSRTHYVLASLTAMAWHLAGDAAARQVWAMGR